MKIENWKDIEGYKYYQVSDMGRVRSLTRKITLYNKGINNLRERILIPRINPRGYYTVALYANRVRLDISIHRVVAKAFIPNPENKPFINHKGGIKTDNRASELEWCTCKENMVHAGKMGLMSHETWRGHFGLRHPGSKRVVCKKSGKIMCVKDAAKESGYSKSHMTNMLIGLRANKTSFEFDEQS